jgi:hypothetical protein
MPDRPEDRWFRVGAIVLVLVDWLVLGVVLVRGRWG